MCCKLTSSKDAGSDRRGLLGCSDRGLTSAGLPMQVPKDLVAEEAHQKPAFADAQVDPQAGMVGGRSQAQQQAEAELEARTTEQQQQPQQQQAHPQQRVPDKLLKPAVVSDEDQKAAAANKASALAAISASQNAGRQQRTAVKEGGALELDQDAGVPAVRSNSFASMLLGSTHAAQLFAVAGACLVLVLWRLRSRRKRQGEAVILQPALAGSDGPMSRWISSRTSRQRFQLAQ